MKPSHQLLLEIQSLRVGQEGRWLGWLKNEERWTLPDLKKGGLCLPGTSVNNGDIIVVNVG